MAKPIRAIPTLRGKDADRFIKKMIKTENSPISKKDKRLAREVKDVALQLENVDDFCGWLTEKAPPNGFRAVENKKTILELGENDIGIKVDPEGSSEVFIPFRNEGENILTHQQINKMLKEIRKLEVVFTELTNETYVEDEEDE